MAVADPQKLMGGAKTTQTPVAQPQQQLIAAPADTAALQGISKSLTNIIQLLNEQKSQIAAEANQERKDLENARRKKIELGLENSFSAVKNVAQSVVAPVKNILDQIIQFFVTLFLGKALLNLIDWFSNPENQDKVRSIARFLKDWWPSLVAGYILFGTGFGRVVRNLAGIGLRAVVALGGIALKIGAAIANAVRLKKAGAAMSALGGGGGFKGIAARLLTGTALVAGGSLVAKNMMGGGEDAPQVSVPEPATLPTAEAFGGGLIDFKAMLAASGGQVDSKLGIFAQLFGSGGFAEFLHSIPGVVSGPKGIDKVPAMLTDGEFVMSRGAVQKFGVDTLEAMNAAGGGTNRPRIVQKRIYAEGGGQIGDGPVKKEGQEDPPLPLNESEEKQRISKYDAEYGEGAYFKKLAEVGGSRVQEDPNKQQRIDTNTQLLSGQRKSEPTPPRKRVDYTSISGIKIPALKVNSKALQSSTQGTSNSKPPAKAKIPFGTGVSLKGESTGRDLGIGYGEKTQGRDALVVKGGAEKMDLSLVLDGKRYYGMKRGDDAVYAALDRRDTAVPSGGLFQPGGLFGGPRMSARMDYAQSKGKYYSSSDQKTYANYNDAEAARKSRMTSLASQQRLDKLSSAGATRSSRGVRFDAEAKARNEDFKKRGGLLGQIGRGFTSMFGSQKDIDRNKAEDAAATLKMKQEGAASIGRYFSSSDGKYYKDYNAADKARKARVAKLGTNKPARQPITPTPKPAPKVVATPQPAGGGMGGGRGGSRKPSVPSFPTSKNNSKTAKQYGIK